MIQIGELHAVYMWRTRHRWTQDSEQMQTQRGSHHRQHEQREEDQPHLPHYCALANSLLPASSSTSNFVLARPSPVPPHSRLVSLCP